DVWLYILANDIPFNDAYKQGFSRVGCWCCPNNSSWSEYLSSIYMNEEYKKFHETLYSFARKIGKPDWKEYIDEGSWKARQGGNGLEHSKNAVVSFKPCAFDETSFNFALSRPLTEDFYTLLKPFGKLDFQIGNKRLGEVYVLNRRTNEPLLKITGRIGSTEIRATVLKVFAPFKNPKEIGALVKNQITKYQTCIACAYCQAVCKFNALKVTNTQKGNVSTESVAYAIDENKCVGCLECVRHFTGGCYMRKVLTTKKGE
ncbi:MAG: phosphoadenosine phosphosulfate reductase family protein, partial [Bacilli bacterium]|nr:phosphoadenosine phosphosulfate reductase family protein [Bacilli bacterium]